MAFYRTFSEKELTKYGGARRSRIEQSRFSVVRELVPAPADFLEIGPGLGRSLVFFSKKLGWDQSEIHAYDGGGTTSKYTMPGPRSNESFCGNLNMLRHVLKFNGVDNVKLFNAHEVQLADLPGPYDLIYSFY